MSQEEMPGTHDTAVVAEPSAAPERSKNVRMMLIGFAGLVVILLAAVIGVGVYRAYAKNATDNFTVTVARVLRLPAMKVNGQTILYKDFAEDLLAINKMRDFDRGRSGPGGTLTDTDLVNQVMDRMVKNTLVNEAANVYNISVTDEEIRGFKAEVLQAQGLTTDTQADEALGKLYGWNLATYERKVMRPLILYKKTGTEVEKDPKQIEELRTLARVRAEGILAQIKGGADFATLAAEYSEDGTAQSGGELTEWLNKEDINPVPEFVEAAFALKKGEMTQELVETQYGYHIIKLVDKRVEKVADPKTKKLVNQEQIRVRHIIIRPSIDRYLEVKLKAADIHLYINAENPYEKK